MKPMNENGITRDELESLGITEDINAGMDEDDILEPDFTEGVDTNGETL
ncbi:hypothetical protein [Veillonella magna]|uniref:Uncharacterized protein n=1 Tax=Veillonella magna TaxID=464322 RepID=A0ABS2GFH4_9FIRM|nr:hypothetical protein [Veillonella magna]MBM6823555.1 hypothetical protein [Veillonella magna]MBM6911899.1 hypothetical protein [Veillonella magna]